jgi:hypothetical protein
MRDGSTVCPEMGTCVAVCRVLYTLSPADLTVAEGVSAGYADHERFFVLCFARGHHLSPRVQGRLQLVNDELAALDVRFKVRVLRWLQASTGTFSPSGQTAFYFFSRRGAHPSLLLLSGNTAVSSNFAR